MVADSRPEPQQPQRSFIARFFIFLFKLIMLLVVIAGGIAMGVGAASWINLSNDTNNIQTRRLNDMQVEMVGVRQYEDQIASVSNKADFIDGVVGDVKDDVGAVQDDLGAMASDLSDLSETVASQADMISAQQEQVTALTEAQAGILNDLADAQVDVEALAQTADDIGVIVNAVSDDTASVDSAISTLQGQISDLETSLADLESSVVLSGTVATVVAEEETDDDGATVAADVAPVQVDLTLVRILGHIARAKIHLLENDITSAGQAIEDATALSTDETLSSSLQDALDNLESKPAASAIALDEAWNALDALLDS